MILKHIVEQVQAAFPLRSRTQIVFEVNRAQQLFCQRTGVLHSVVELTKAADKIAEDADALTLTYQLPATTYELVSIDELPKMSFHLKDDTLVVHTVNSNNVADPLTVWYSRMPAVLANDTEIPAIPEFLHEALVSMVLAKFHRMAGNVDGYIAESTLVREHEKEARRYINSVHYRNTGAFAGEAMAYKIAYGSQTLVPGRNTINMGKTFTSVNSYVVLLNPGPSTVQEPSPKERTTSSFVVIAAEDVDDFEYYAHGT